MFYGLLFVQIFGGFIHGNVRDFELDHFPNELDKFWKRVRPFLVELDHFAKQLECVHVIVMSTCNTKKVNLKFYFVSSYDPKKSKLSEQEIVRNFELGENSGELA